MPPQIFFFSSSTTLKGSTPLPRKQETGGQFHSVAYLLSKMIRKWSAFCCSVIMRLNPSFSLNCCASNFQHIICTSLRTRKPFFNFRKKKRKPFFNAMAVSPHPPRSACLPFALFFLQGRCDCDTRALQLGPFVTEIFLTWSLCSIPPLPKPFVNFQQVRCLGLRLRVGTES